MDQNIVKTRIELEETIQRQEAQIMRLKTRLKEIEKFYCEKGFYIEKLLTELQHLKGKLQIIEQIARD